MNKMENSILCIHIPRLIALSVFILFSTIAQAATITWTNARHHARRQWKHRPQLCRRQQHDQYCGSNHQSGPSPKLGADHIPTSSLGGNNTWQFTDTNATNFPQRFYSFHVR
jgi:hypothetical protein